jgi:type IV pilus assembly protein PilC
LVYILELKRIFMPFFTGFTTKQKMIMFQEMEHMLDAGISIYNMFTHMLERSSNHQRKIVLKKFKDLVDAGSTISTGMACFPEYFSEDDIRLMEIGEETGNMDKACKIIWQKWEKMLFIKSKVVLAAWYPITLITITPMILSIKYLFLESLNSYLQHSVIPEICVITGVFIAFIAFRLFRVTPGFRDMIDQLILMLPLFGKIKKKLSISRFASTFSMLYSGGIHLGENLRLSSRISNNAALEHSIMKIIPNIIDKGQPLSQEFDKIGFFPPEVIQLIAVGEETGKFDVTLQKVSEYSMQEADRALTKFLQILPVIIFLIIATIIGYMVIKMWLDIYAGIFDKIKQVPHQ